MLHCSYSTSVLTLDTELSFYGCETEFTVFFSLILGLGKSMPFLLSILPWLRDSWIPQRLTPLNDKHGKAHLRKSTHPYESVRAPK